MGIADRLALPEAEAWRPEPGDQVVGIVLGTEERTGDYGPYPVVIIEEGEDGGGDLVAVHCFHSVLRNEVEANDLQAGDRIGIAYRGKRQGGKAEYENYRVIVEKADAASAAKAAESLDAAADAKAAQDAADEEPF